MKEVVFIVPPEKFRDEELFAPMEQLRKIPVHIEIASTLVKTIQGVKGAKIDSTLNIADVGPDDFDAYIVVGGLGTHQHLWYNKQLHELLHDASQKGKLIAGICSGSVVLAHAGLLKGKRATTFQSESYIDELLKAGAIYKAHNIEMSGNIITASGPEVANEFGKEISSYLRNSLGHKMLESVTVPYKNTYHDY